MKIQFTVALLGFIFLNFIAISKPASAASQTATASPSTKLEDRPHSCADFASGEQDLSTPVQVRKAQSVSDLLHSYRQKRRTNAVTADQSSNFNSTNLHHSKKAKFSDAMNGFDVYNPTKPFRIRFKDQELEVMAARVESRDSERSQVMFFTEANHIWSPVAGAPIFQMQDPFITFIDNELILGGVEIFEKPGGGYGYKTIFLRGQSLESLVQFAEGPLGMKDIRLVQISKNKIGLFTRPQGMIPGTGIDAGPGRIGFTVIDSLAQLTVENILAAKLFPSQFISTEWGGVNEAQLRRDGKIAALAHIARFDKDGNRHYYPVAFLVDPVSGLASTFEILFERRDLVGGLDGESKRIDLKDVVFSGGLTVNSGRLVADEILTTNAVDPIVNVDGGTLNAHGVARNTSDLAVNAGVDPHLGVETSTAYVGAGDAELHIVTIPTPEAFKTTLLSSGGS